MPVVRFFATLSVIILLSNTVVCFAKQQKQVALVGTHINLKMAHRIEGALLSMSSERPSVHRYDPHDEAQMNELYKRSFDLVVTLGTDSTERALKRCLSSRIFALLIPQHSYFKLKKAHPKSQFTALFIDQPVGRQFNLIELLMLPSETESAVGIILGPDSARIQDIIQNEATERAMKLNMVHVHDNEAPIGGLSILMDNISFLLAIGDDHIYNPYTARGILVATFRRKVPLISHTHAYVRKGALAAVYSSPQQIVQDATRFIMDLLSLDSQALLAPRYPKHFSVAVNFQAAQSLERPVQNEATLLQALKAKEETSPEGEYCELLEQFRRLSN